MLHPLNFPRVVFMLSKCFSRFFIFVLSLSLCACGGGGGGGGGGSSARTGVRILHGAIDVTPLDLYSTVVDGLVQTTKFASNNFYAGLPEGDQVLTATRALTPQAPAFSLPISVAKNQRQSLLVYGNTESLGVRQNILNDDPGEVPTGSAAVRVVHALNGAAAINATFAGQEITASTPFGSASAYVYLPPGIANLSVTRDSDKAVVFSGPHTVEDRKAYTFLITGEVNYLVVAPQYLDN